MLSISISWTLFKLPYFEDLIDLHSILIQGSPLLKSINEFRYFGEKDLQHRLLIESCLTDVDFLEKRTEEIAKHLNFRTALFSDIF